MYSDSSNSEMGCAAILMAQHTHVWAPVRGLGLILSHHITKVNKGTLTLHYYWVTLLCSWCEKKWGSMAKNQKEATFQIYSFICNLLSPFFDAQIPFLDVQET